MCAVRREPNLFYRYVLATPKWQLLETETIQQLLLVLIHMQDRFSGVMEEASLGGNRS